MSPQSHGLRPVLPNPPRTHPAAAAGSWGQNLVAHDVEPNHLRGLPLVEVTLHRRSDVGPKLLQRVGLGKDSLPDRSGGEPALGSLIHDENDLGHGSDRQKRINAAASRREPS